MSENKWSKDVELHEGALERLGWKEHESAESRHRALERSVREFGYARTVERLDFMANVASREDNRGLHHAAREDLDWLRRWEAEDREGDDRRREQGTEHRVRPYEKDDGERVRGHLARNPRRRR
jgi:hypothetical protein